MNRLSERKIIENNSLEFLKQYKRGDKKFISYYATKPLDYPSDKRLGQIQNYVFHVWSSGDSFQKLAYEYYAVPEYWWMLAWINKKPTEFHVALGETILIPKDITEVQEMLGI